MSEQQLKLVTLRGSTEEAGFAYGQHFQQMLNGFLTQEVPPTKSRLAYAKACWKKLCKQAPKSAAFMRGISRGSDLSIEEVTLLSLHEEIVHQTHCTGVITTGNATKNKHTLIGQNWDWKSWRYPWPGLLKLQIKDAPRMLTYHYPGLWASLGINEHGLALMWTGAGYWPRLKPIVGVPTYALIFELLQLKTTNEAILYLKKNQQAGCFVFLIADANGDTAVVEATPGKIAIERGPNLLSRANHYECREMVRASRQKLPLKKMSNTKTRGALTSKILKTKAPHSISSIQSLLTKNKELYRATKEHMTIDSFVADCQKRTLYVARGGNVPGRWRAYRV